MQPIQIKKNKVLSALAVTQNTTSASLPAGGLDMNVSGVDGYFSAEITVTGAGSATIGYECSSDGATWFKPSTQAAADTAITVATGFDASGGPDSDGKYYMQLTNIPTCNFLRFYVTEENVGAVTVTMTLIEQ
jgi:hypothetical protein